MKKQEVKIILIAAALGIFLGIVDTFFDYLYFYEDSFFNLLITDVPEHELYIRTLIFICFLTFGYISAKLISRLREKEAKQAELISELENALNEIKVLKGILPICSFCKKIRDDQGYWNQVEVYVREHSNANFSHSICPSCAQKHYPDFAKHIKADTVHPE